MSNQRTIVVNDDKVEAAQKAMKGRQPGLKEDPRRIGMPDESELQEQSYLVKKESFINGTIVPVGVIVKLPAGVKAGKYLEPVRVVTKHVEKTADGDEITEEKTKPALDNVPDAPIPASAPKASGKAAAKLGTVKVEEIQPKDDVAGDDNI